MADRPRPVPGFPDRNRRASVPDLVELGPEALPVRAALQSSPGVPGEVFEAVRDLDTKLSRVELELAQLRQSIAEIKASGRAETLKVLVGGVITCVTAVIGSRVVAPQPVPTQTVIERSAFDRALDTCAKLPGDTDRGACIARVVQEQAGAR